MKKTLENALIILSLLIVFSFSVYGDLELGDRGNDVKEVQQLLFDLGYNISVDGVFAYRTKEIVEDFQDSNNLTVDGIVGDKTLSLLEERTEEIIHIVKNGDTLSEIALQYDSTKKSIQERNKLESDRIKIGQKLFIPRTGKGDGKEENLYSIVNHEVRRGDSLSVIAQRHGSTVQSIKKANNISGDRIKIGQRLDVPHLADGPDGDLRDSDSFIWPVRGRISSPYGYRDHPIRKERHFHAGIDIAVPTGTNVKAAAAARVVQSGWVSGFGETIVLDHGEGIRTLYAHNSRLLVSPGEKVKRGQTIAISGSTGQSTGPHLDFRIYFDGETANPVDYLP